MDNIFISATERTPEIDFNFISGCLSIEGESYPSNAFAFFGPLLIALEAYLESVIESNVILDIKMDYFNSSSAKALMNLFKLVDTAAKSGKSVIIRWHYQKNDETMYEFGEDFSEDLGYVEFQMVGVD